MIKDIIVNLSVIESGGYAGDFAVSVASAVGAHLTGIAFVFDPIVPVAANGYFPPDLIETQLRANEAAANVAIDRFNAGSQARGYYRGANQAACQLCQRRRAVRPHRPAFRSRHCGTGRTGGARPRRVDR